MNGIFRYVLRQLAIGLAFVVPSLTVVVWLTQSARYVELIVTRGMSVPSFLYFTMMLLPTILAWVLPVAMFLVTQFTYQKLSLDREIVVMRAVGLSHARLAGPALVMAAVVMVLCYAINLYILPVSYAEFRDLKYAAQNNLANVPIQEGMFNEISNSLTVYVRQRQSDGEMLGLLVYDTHQSDSPVTLMAERGQMIKGPNGPRILLWNGNRQKLDHHGNLSMVTFESDTLDFASFNSKAEPRFRDAFERGLVELLTMGPEEIGAANLGKYRVEGHQRLSTPLNVPAFTLIAVLAVLFAPKSGRQSQLWPTVVPFSIMVGLQAATLGAEGLAARDLLLVPLIYLLPLATIGIGAGLLLKPERAGSFALARTWIPLRR